MKSLRLAPGLALPTSFATEGVAVIGMRGSGKSNTVVRFAELLYWNDLPWVAVDPKGDWHGIRSSADGKNAGLSVPVFGGLYADFPLEPSLGARIADLLVDENLSAVLDVSAMSKTSQLPTFLTAFCNQLMARHQREPHVRTVLLEEAHRYIPQVVSGPVARMKEAAASVLLEGRAFGLGCWAITQRPARLHKDVLEECGSVIVHRIGAASTHDKATIKGWVEHYGLASEIVASLTSLRAGEAWVLIPESDIVQRVQVDRRETFDSAATPTTGKVRRTMKLADIDKDAITQSLADVIEKAKADDPRTLQLRIAELERNLAAKPAGVRIEEVRVEVPYVPPALREAVLSAGKEIGAALGSMQRAHKAWDTALQALADEERRPTPPRRVPPTPPTTQAPGRVTLRASDGLARPPAVVPNGDLPDKQRAILVALAPHAAGLPRRKLAARIGLSPKKSTLRGHLADLRKRDYLYQGEPLVLTDAGLSVAETLADPLPTGPDLLGYWRSEIGENNSTRRVFEALFDAYPHDLDKYAIGNVTGIEPTSSTLRGALAELRTLDVVDGWRISDDLMEAIRGG